MFFRSRHYGAFVSVLTCLGLTVAAGCGGTPAASKTTAVEAKKEPAKDAQPAPSGDDKKPEGTEAKAEKKTDKPAAETKPSGPKERFALPNVELTAPEDRKKVVIGGKEVTAEACLLDTSVSELKSDWFPDPLRMMAAAPDGSIYLVDQDKKVRHYIPEAGDTCKLAIDASFGEKGMLTLPEEAEHLMVLPDGTLVALGFNGVHKYVGGKVETVDCRVKELFPDGKTAFYHFVDEVKRVEFGKECKETEWKYKGWDPLKAEPGKDPEKWSFQSIRPWDKDLLVHVTAKGDHYLGIHSQDGKLKIKMGKDREKDKNLREGEDMCYVADIEKCAAGACVLDSNCRRLTAWDTKKGEMVDSAEISDLIGVFYPWPVALVPTKGVSYMGITAKEKRDPDVERKPDDKEFSYGMIFRIKGLN